MRYAQIAWIAPLLFTCVAVAATLDKGHRILLDHGIQIQGQVFYVPQDLGLERYAFDSAAYLNARFTGINWHLRPLDPAFAARHPGLPWGRWTTVEAVETKLTEAEQPYAGTLIALQFGDEQSLDDPVFRAACARWFTAARPHFPDTLLYTNQLAFNASPENLTAYMNESQPDMLFMDSYRWKIGDTEGTWNLFSDMQRYRKFALAGHIGSGNQPIPYGLFPQVFHGEDLWRDPSESELRINHFAAWAMGYTFTSIFTFNYPSSALFSPGYDTARPTPIYRQLKTINEEGQKLGPALVRLVSRDVLFVPGEHRTDSGGTASNRVPIDVPAYPRDFGAIRKDPFIRGVRSVKNLGKCNRGLPGDMLLTWFQVLDESLDGEEFTGEWYFMVTNALVDSRSSATQTRQRIQINFSAEVPPVVQRLDRRTGQARDVALEVIPSSGGRRALVLELDGGTGDLFKFKTGAPFVGVDRPRP